MLESDLARIKVGQNVELIVDAIPGEVFQGKVRFIDPTLDSQRRTARVRVVVSTDGRLRTGMLVEGVSMLRLRQAVCRES